MAVNPQWTKQWLGPSRNHKRNSKILWDELKWKHNIAKLMGYS